MSCDLRMLAVHAHPDDESSKGAATMAKYADEGVRVRVVTCTGGERGSILNPHLANREEAERDLPAYRREEMARAAEALGIEHQWLGFVDSGLPEGDPLPPLPEGCFAAGDIDEQVQALVKVIREFRPQVMTTYNERGGYPHPDHIRTHEVSIAAYEAAADPDYHRELGDPWAVCKLYYDVSFTLTRMIALHEALLGRGMISPFGGRIDAKQAGDMPPDRPVSARINIAQYFPQRDAALRAHATQIDPKGFFFAMPRDLEAEIWPWEEFEIARTRVEVAPGIETDLFAGLRGQDCG